MRDICWSGNALVSLAFERVSKPRAQRDERHIIKTLVSARNLGYGDHSALISVDKPWGETNISIQRRESILFFLSFLFFKRCIDVLILWKLNKIVIIIKTTK